MYNINLSELPGMLANDIITRLLDEEYIDYSSSLINYLFFKDRYDIMLSLDGVNLIKAAVFNFKSYDTLLFDDILSKPFSGFANNYKFHLSTALLSIADSFIVLEKVKASFPDVFREKVYTLLYDLLKQRKVVFTCHYLFNEDNTYYLEIHSSDDIIKECFPESYLFASCHVLRYENDVDIIAYGFNTK